MKRSLAVELPGMILPTPVMVASGCAGTGRELTGFVDPRRVGGQVSRTITVLPRKGAPTPRIAEVPTGIVWETGLQNPGIDAFVQEELVRLARGRVPTFVSIGGGTLEEFVRLTSALQRRPEVAAIEVHLSSRDDELDREMIGSHADRVFEIVGAVARMSSIPVFAKLPGGAVADGVVEVTRAAVRAGATGVTLLGSPPALAVDARSLRPELGAVTGWLAGPVLRPMMLRAVFEVARALPDVPVIACGGIASGVDAVEALLAGASAVQVGTATLIDPAAPLNVARGVATYLRSKGLRQPSDLRGRLRVPAGMVVSSEGASG